MKKILLFVCAFPFLLNAQNAKMKVELKEKNSMQQLLKSLPAEKLHQVRTYSGAENLLPDSIYTYADEENTVLVNKTFFKYDEEGRPIEQRTVVFRNEYDPDNNEYVIREYEYKSEYAYSVQADLMTMKVTSSYLSGGTWIIEKEGGIKEYIVRESDFEDFLNMQLSFEQYFNLYILEYYSYNLNEDTDEWDIAIKIIAVEFDDADRPTVFDIVKTESSYDEDVEDFVKTEKSLRWEVDYNDYGLRNSLSTFGPSDDPEDPWELIEREEYFYNADLQLEKTVITDKDDNSQTYEYEYDENGYIVKEVYSNDEYTATFECKYDEQGSLLSINSKWDFYFYDEEEDEYYTESEEYDEYYVNFYTDGSANEVILSIQTAVYPNPASDVLNVTIAGAGEALITMVNMTGSCVFQQKTSLPVISIPVQSFAKGYYLLTIQAGDRIKSHKVFIR